MKQAKVSVIIPTKDNVALLRECIGSILEKTNYDNYEIIIVNNGSGKNETKSYLRKIGKHPKITIIEYTKEFNFSAINNYATKYASGEYLLFLNDDVVVTNEWMQGLVETMQVYPKCGAVGCKLLLMNNTLQEAGCIIWKDGSTLGYGRGDDPKKPEYSYLREVDFCSAACLLVRKDVFKQVDGFDERYHPAYYEDSDFGLKIWNAGYKYIFQPKVELYHTEYGSHSPLKSFDIMKKNQKIFSEKWKKQLKEKFSFSAENILFARDRNKGRRILFLDDRIPAPNLGAGYPRAYSMLRDLTELGYKMTFFPLLFTDFNQDCTDGLLQSGIEVFFGKNIDLARLLIERSTYYDLILISRPQNMAVTYALVKQYSQRSKIIYDAEAIFAEREVLSAKIKNIKMTEREKKQIIADELKLSRNADVVMTVSENDKRSIEKLAKIKNVVSWSYPIKHKEAANQNGRKDILFVGSFLAGIGSPNDDAITYFINEIFPELHKKIGCKLFVVGRDPPQTLKDLASKNIIVTGYVEDIRPYYDRCKCFVVPHRFSAGIPLKLLEAMSCGIPCVVSELTASQLNLEDGKEALVARNKKEFIDKIIKIFNDEKLWDIMQKNGLDYIKKECDPEKLKIKLDSIIKGALKIKPKSELQLWGIMKGLHMIQDVLNHLSMRIMQNFNKAKYHYYIDTLTVADGAINLDGWIFSDDTSIQCLKIILKNNRKKLVFPIIYPLERKDVFMAYKSKNAMKSGFHLYTRLYIQPGISNGEYELYLQAENMNGICKKVFLKKIAIYDQYKEWMKRNEPNKNELEEQSRVKFGYSPKISLIMPTWNTPIPLLEETIESVRKQTYHNWELCIVDGSDNSDKDKIRDILKRYAKTDKKIKVRLLSRNKGISGNSNEAFKLADGEFMGLLDHDDLLAPFALFEVVKALNNDKTLDFIYSDRDMISPEGFRYNHFFKPDWSPDYLLSQNYLCHLNIIRKKLVDKIKGFRKKYDGAQDYDLFLRVTELTDKIMHIPKILYHWRASKNSAAVSLDNKPYAETATIKVLQEAVRRRGWNGKAVQGLTRGLYRIKFQVKGNPKVSIIIPTQDKGETLKACIDSILKLTTYKNYEIIIVDNNSSEEATFAYYKELKKISNLKLLKFNKAFNFSEINNYAASKTRSDYLLFLNNDVKVISGDWLEIMLGFAQRQRTGAVGARLSYFNNTIQTAGLAIAEKGKILRLHNRYPKDDNGYGSRILSTQNISAISGACMMVRRDVFNEVGGFAGEYAVNHGDIDFCLKLRQKGYLIVYEPHAELYHHESLTRGLDGEDNEKMKRQIRETKSLLKKWGHVFGRTDPYYNPNLSQNKEDFSINI